jgi:hypothetical protein
MWRSAGIAPPFLTSGLDGGLWSASRPGRFIPEERAHSTHYIGGWVGFRTGLDDVERRKILLLPRFELRPLCHPVTVPTVLSRLSRGYLHWIIIVRWMYKYENDSQCYVHVHTFRDLHIHTWLFIYGLFNYIYIRSYAYAHEFMLMYIHLKMLKE